MTATVGDKSNYTMHWTRLGSSAVFGHTYPPIQLTSRRLGESIFSFRLPEQINVNEFRITPLHAYKLVIPEVRIKLRIGITTLVEHVIKNSDPDRSDPKLFNLSTYGLFDAGLPVWVEIAKTQNSNSNFYSMSLWGQNIR